ncbi:TetR/AcrR family transcriptional regulator [Paenibacillus piri]|uniref:TetR/AcrR family transcriptional regulator n=2 Tax=Paenibacillus piri TaxID=2547395 RepID=A0A4R5KHP0_9BACL|nr:TetR/AcrR family transcriptional regulator [Paenibacillus piri]
MMLKRVQDSNTEAIPDDRREQIKRAALRVFARQGIQGTKMSAIAAEAGISQGLSYRYFSSKEQILTMLVQEALDEAQAALRSFDRLPGSPEQQFRAFTQLMLEDRHKHYFMLLQQVSASEDAPVQAKQLIARYSPEDTISLLVPAFIKGQQLGQFCEGDPYKLLFLYFSVITGLMLQDLPIAEDYWPQQVDLLMKILI